MNAAAPVYGTAVAPAAAAESAAWARFADTQDAAEFHAAWLAIMCGQIGRVRSAMLLLARASETGFTPAAAWPDARQDLRHLGPVAERTLQERRGLVQPVGTAESAGAASPLAAHVGYPVVLAGTLHGAVVLDLPAHPPAELQRALRLLHWGSAWLLDRLRQQAADAQARQAGRIAQANALLATCLQHRSLAAAALALVNELAGRLHCDRVSLGLVEQGSVHLQALSHTAHFDARSDLAHALGEAMDEVLDLDSAIVWPADAVDANVADAGQLAAMAAAAHAALAATAGCSGLCSVPLVDEGRTLGVITLELQSGTPFDADTVALCRHLGVLLGPVFALKRQAERSLWRRSADRLAAGRQALLGPGHPGAKLAAGGTVLLLGGLLLLDLPYRVAARSVVEGAVQRAAVAPFDGYIAQGLVRAGDTVRLGQPLARLVDDELRLEHGRWRAELDVAQRRLRQAGASADRAQAAMAAAQVDQAQAQLDLVADTLARATVLAPMDGVVVSGDLTQLQGSPVEQGKLLFEVAPLDRWRVMMEVDERDIGHLQLGQHGQVALAGLPQQALGFAVSRITPLSSAVDGRNVFRVEAQLDQPNPRLRPGMEGVGKVEVGARPALWIWTHSFTDWLRLAWWRWVP